MAIRSSLITRNRKDTVRNSLETPGPAGRDVGSIPTVSVSGKEDAAVDDLVST